MYGKLFDSMYEGTLYGQWEALVTFQQMIVLCDADGMIDMTPQAIAARTSIPLRIIQKGIKILEAIDPYSRTPDQEGRRLELIDAHRPWGWHIVNHEKYTRMQDADTVRAQTRERVRNHRAAKDAVTVTVGNGSKRHTDTYIDTDTNTDKEKKSAQRSRGERLPPGWYPLDDLKSWAVSERPDLNIDKTIEQFRDYWIAVPGSKGLKLDWRATFRKWVRGEKPGNASRQIDFDALAAKIEEEDRARAAN